MNQFFSQQLLLIKLDVTLPLERGCFCNYPYSLKPKGLCMLWSFME